MQIKWRYLFWLRMYSGYQKNVPTMKNQYNWMYIDIRCSWQCFRVHIVSRYMYWLYDLLTNTTKHKQLYITQRLEICVAICNTRPSFQYGLCLLYDASQFGMRERRVLPLHFCIILLTTYKKSHEDIFYRIFSYAKHWFCVNAVVIITHLFLRVKDNRLEKKSVDGTRSATIDRKNISRIKCSCFE